LTAKYGSFARIPYTLEQGISEAVTGKLSHGTGNFFGRLRLRNCGRTDVLAAFEDVGIRAVAYDGADTLSRRIVVAREMAVPVLAIVGGREMRDGQLSLRERNDSQADVPLAEAVSRLRARARPGALVGRSVVEPL
jgi:hypothetical protein